MRAADERVLNKTGSFGFSIFPVETAKIKSPSYGSVMDKWPGQAHHVQRLQGVLALIYQDQNRWHTDCGVGLRMQAPSLLCSIPKEG